MIALPVPFWLKSAGRGGKGNGAGRDQGAFVNAVWPSSHHYLVLRATAFCLVGVAPARNDREVRRQTPLICEILDGRQVVVRSSRES